MGKGNQTHQARIPFFKNQRRKSSTSESSFQLLLIITNYLQQELYIMLRAKLCTETREFGQAERSTKLRLINEDGHLQSKTRGRESKHSVGENRGCWSRFIAIRTMQKPGAIYSWPEESFPENSEVLESFPENPTFPFLGPFFLSPCMRYRPPIHCRVSAPSVEKIRFFFF